MFQVGFVHFFKTFQQLCSANFLQTFYIHKDLSSPFIIISITMCQAYGQMVFKPGGGLSPDRSLYPRPDRPLSPFFISNCLLTPVSLFPCNQGLTVEDVCKQLRRLYVVKNFSLEHSVSITCDPSFSASNEIHVCIVSTSSHLPAPSLTFAFLPPVMHSYKKKQKTTSIYSLQRVISAAISHVLMVVLCHPLAASKYVR